MKSMWQKDSNNGETKKYKEEIFLKNDKQQLFYHMLILDNRKSWINQYFSMFLFDDA